MGDPIETAALEGIGWRYDAPSQTAKPGDSEPLERAIGALKKRIEAAPAPAAGAGAVAAAGSAAPVSGKQLEALKGELAKAQAELKRVQESKARCPVTAVRIVHRHHFSSALQRMSTITKVTQRSGGTAYRVLVKGSPEAVRMLLRSGGEPAWYAEVYRGLAERGMRVLALAYKVRGGRGAGRGRGGREREGTRREGEGGREGESARCPPPSRRQVCEVESETLVDTS